MTDLTILAPQSLVPLPLASPSSDVSECHPSRAGRGPNSNQPASSSAGCRFSNGQQYDPSLLSPPLNTFRAPRKPRRDQVVEERRLPPQETTEDEENATDSIEEEQDPDYTHSHSYTTSFRPFTYHSTPRLIPIQSHSQTGVRPPAPPLFRPKTFWRHTRRSAVTAPSYSPSSHIVRRSTFIAAGLSLDTPHADLSALSVELRTGTISLVPSTALPL
ncbi:hypothetical protein ACEPAG_6450 [Sanghuangporus baumii]